MSWRVIPALAVLLTVATGAVAFEAEVKSYQQALARVCITGVTPELQRLYLAALQAIEAAQSRGALPRSFAGLRSPDRAYLDCFQGR